MAEESIQRYLLTQDNKDYYLTTSVIDGEKIRFRLEEKDNRIGSYYGDYSILDLRTINTIFDHWEIPVICQQSMETSILNKTVGIINREDLVQLILYMDFNGERERIPITLAYDGPCKLQNNMHYPDRLDRVAQDDNRIRNEQMELRRQIEDALNPQSQPPKLKSSAPRPQGQLRSDIVKTAEEYKMLYQRINRGNQIANVRLLYKATRDGDTAKDFHRKCDDANMTVVLVEASNGTRFGGFTTRTWKGDCENKKDDQAFVFSLDKLRTYDIISQEDAIGAYPFFGPVFFGCQIRIYDNCFQKGGSTYLKSKNYKTTQDYELTGGLNNYGVKEIEVFEIQLQ